MTRFERRFRGVFAFSIAIFKFIKWGQFESFRFNFYVLIETDKMTLLFVWFLLRSGPFVAFKLILALYGLYCLCLFLLNFSAWYFCNIVVDFLSWHAFLCLFMNDYALLKCRSRQLPSETPTICMHWAGVLKHDLWLIYDWYSDDWGHLPANNCWFSYSIQHLKHIVQNLMLEVMFTSFIRMLHNLVILDSPWGPTLEHRYAIHVIFNENLRTQIF